jgi:hypothetical protein
MQDLDSAALASVTAFKHFVADLLSQPLRTDPENHINEILQTIDGLAEKFRSEHADSGAKNEQVRSLFDEVANNAYRILDLRKKSLGEIQTNTAVYIFNIMQKQAQLEQAMQPLLKIADKFRGLSQASADEVLASMK